MAQLAETSGQVGLVEALDLARREGRDRAAKRAQRPIALEEDEEEAKKAQQEGDPDHEDPGHPRHDLLGDGLEERQGTARHVDGTRDHVAHAR